MVEKYIELQAPPEHIVNGIDNEENKLSRTFLMREDIEGWFLSIKVKKEYENIAKIKS